MRVAVTGASGFVGAAACRALVAAGHDVVGFGRRPDGPEVLGESRYRRWTLPDRLEDPPPADVVVHCAAAVDDWAPLVDQRLVTVVGTRRVLATWPRARVVHVSSASVYDPWRGGVVRETDGPAARFAGPYAQAKAEAEHVVAAARRDAVVLRPHAVHGPGDPVLLPRLLAAVRRGVLVVPGPADTLVHLTAVDVVARAVVAAVESSVTGAVNVGDAQAVPLGEAVDGALTAALGAAPRRVHLPATGARALGAAVEAVARAARRTHPPVLTRYAVSHLAVDRVLDLTRLRDELGVDPAPTAFP